MLVAQLYCLVCRAILGSKPLTIDPITGHVDDNKDEQICSKCKAKTEDEDD
jgi:hypothetical protein